jgi:hypothetical protein
MARPCKVCVHEERERIELDIINQVPYVQIEAQYGMSIASVSRHKDHMAERIAQAKRAEDVASGGTLLERLEILERDARRIAKTAEENDRLAVALQANREQQRIIELLLKVAGDLKNQTEISVTVSPEWIQLRAVIFKVLENYPEAKRALALELQRIQHDSGEDVIDAVVKVYEPSEETYRTKELPSGQET